MKTLEEAQMLAQQMVQIGEEVGRTTIALITAMDEPLGSAIGNALEVKEAIAVLTNRSDGRLRQLSLELASEMVLLSGLCEDKIQALQRVEEVLNNGQAFAKLISFVRAQGGNPDVLFHPELLPTAKYQIEVRLEQDGYVQAIDSYRLGHVAMLLGAGRLEYAAEIDLAVGITLKKRVGDPVTANEVIAILHVSDLSNENIGQWVASTSSAFIITAQPTKPLPILLGRCTHEGFIP
jgi:thymidine phosphorylase